ncbi:MAG: FAD-dependent thymidylate synthase [Nanoarchaeota archaeon]|nr:FAD-dependent thymidylate synthase [Nanoarchaeota archaeon]
MEISIRSTPNGIRTLKGALKYCQNFARVCYAKEELSEVRKERYNPQLVENRLIATGHHSVFDQFNFGLYFNGVPKAMAMVLNNEPPLTTSEKSARYTVMENVSEAQKYIYDKWMEIIGNQINEIFPNIEDRDNKIKKLAQENARYMTSVFTPTKMGYATTLRQLNILADNFEKFKEKIGDDKFKQRLFEEGMLPFLNSEVVKRFRIKGLEDKSDRGVKLFGNTVEEYFGQDIYSTSLLMSFACLAQNHRHRTIHNQIVDGWEIGAPKGYSHPPILESDTQLTKEWSADLDSVAKNDFPQAQLLNVTERGLREDLEMKIRERNCGLAQLEIVHVMDDLLKRYSVHIPEIGKLRGATCITSGKGCKKGGCHFGSKMAISRPI